MLAGPESEWIDRSTAATGSFQQALAATNLEGRVKRWSPYARCCDLCRPAQPLHTYNRQALPIEQLTAGVYQIVVRRSARKKPEDLRRDPRHG